MKQDALSEGVNNKEACTPTSRLNSSLIRIDSIYINIYAAKQCKPEKCDHFTIRGYVSENRKKNGGNASSKDSSTLIPLDVTKFKRWQCKNCLSEIDTEGASRDIQNVTVNCCNRPHRSLEDIIAHLSKKLKQIPELGSRHRKGTKSISEFTSKQIVDSALDLFVGDRRGNEMCGAASNYISDQPAPGDFTNQLVSLKNVVKHHKQRLKPLTIPSTKVITVNGAKHKERHAAALELIHVSQNLDDSGATGRRKPKKIRLLDELLDKKGNGAQPVVTADFHANGVDKVSCSGKKRNKKCLEQYSRHSQMHNAGSSDGKSNMRKAQDTNIFAYTERHIASKDDRSDLVVRHADNMPLVDKRGTYVQKNYHGRGQKRKIESCRTQGHWPTSQPLYGGEPETYHNNIMPSSRSKGKSNDTLNKARGGVNVPDPADDSKELDVNSVPNMLMEADQISHHIPSIQDEHPSKSQYLFSDRCLDTRKGARYYVPHTENQNLRTDINTPYAGESSSACKSSVEKNIWHGTCWNPGLKRPDWGTCLVNSKPNCSARTEQGATVVPQMEFSSRNINKKMVASQKNSEITHSKLSNNMTQEVGTSDDIPMEIVELMAKNQYERRQHEVGNNHYVLQSASNPQHDVVGISTGLPSYMVAPAAHNKNSHLLNARDVSGKGLGISNKKPNGYMVQRSYIGDTYDPVSSSQRELSSVLRSSALDSGKPGNYKYDINNFPPEDRVSSRSQAMYEAWRHASRQNDKTVRSWSMIPPTHPVHMPGVSQNSAFHPFDVGTVPMCLSYAVESQGLGNLSLAGPGHTVNFFRPEASYTSRPNNVDVQPQMTGSPNPYDNETIPAMHLLSLMDGGVQTTTPTNKEAKANNRKTFDRSFSNDHLAKELSVNNVGVDKSSRIPKQPSSYSNQSKARHSDASGSIVFPLAGDVGSKKDTQPPMHHPEVTYLNNTAGGSLLSTEKIGFISQKPWLASTDGVAGQEPVLAHDLSKPIFSPFASVSGSSHLCMNGNINGYCNMKFPLYYNTQKRLAEPGACCLNRNPMDFTAPGPGNEFMIGTEELKFGNRTHIPYITRPNAFRHPRSTSVHCLKQ